MTSRFSGVSLAKTHRPAPIASKLSNRDVASELGLSEHTVKKYLFKIFEKLGISSRVELVLYALHHGTPQQLCWAAEA
jgi:FixJ family two-component response regulator